MIKLIRSDQLLPGMYIHDLNCGWIDHPFAFNQFRVRDQATVNKILAYGIRELYIDTTQGLDVKDARTLEEVSSELDKKLFQVAREANPLPPTSIEEEIVVAREVHHEANKVVHTILSDVRLGKQIEVERMEPVVERITDSIFRNKDALTSLGRIKRKDDYTFQHSVSVCTLLVSFAHAMGFAREVVLEMGLGGLLHDTGKMRVPDSVLNKPGALTDAEFLVMKSHAAIGRDILRETPGISETAILVAGQHHERFDGTGYPDKLKGSEISEVGQMASIVDVYDALTSNRVYHKGMEPTDALKKLFEWSKFHFNEELVQQFIRVIGIYPTGSLVSLESGLLAVVVKPGEQSLLKPLVRIIFDPRTGFVSPRDVDLADRHSTEKVVGHELPDKWKINPFKYL
ncbi:MAG: HD-GYP domain-containing protein [Sulfuricella sp.]|nr:HD-GYP domain-containing protein [Sulfuricella sp.]